MYSDLTENQSRRINKFLTNGLPVHNFIYKNLYLTYTNWNEFIFNASIEGNLLLRYL